MFENHHQPLASRSTFWFRFAVSTILGLMFIAIALFIGMLGYRSCGDMSWLDAFVNAAMILSGMGPLAPLTCPSAKLFAGFYALFSGLAFILIIGMIFAPVIHRLFHKFHIQTDSNSR